MISNKELAPTNVDEYIAGFPEDIQWKLQKIRTTIRKAAPEVEETFKYKIPTFVLKGNLISFAAYKNHIGLYPAPKGTPSFNKTLARYLAEKSTVRIPLDEPVPYELINQMVLFRVEDNLKRAESKAKKKKSK